MKSSPTKIGFYMTTVLDHPGGMEHYLKQTAKYMNAQEGLRADIITMDYAMTNKIGKLLGLYYFKKTEHKKVSDANIDAIRREVAPANYYMVSSFKELRSKLNEYDVIYSKNEILEALIFKLILKYKRLPRIIFGCHTPLKYPVATRIQAKLHNVLYCSLIYKYLCSGVAAFHVLNESEKNICKSLFPRKRVYKIHNPFNFDAFTPKKSHNHKSYSIAWVGRVSEQKGVDRLCEIIQMVNEAIGSKISWNILATGKEEKYSNELKKITQTFTNIKLRTQISNEQMPDFYAENDLLINTSRWEGFPYTLIEAQSIGLPVVCYNIPGCNEIIDTGRNGVLVTDEDAFAKAIINQLDVPINANFIRDYIRRKFAASIIYQKLIKMIHDVA